MSDQDSVMDELLKKNAELMALQTSHQQLLDALRDTVKALTEIFWDSPPTKAEHEDVWNKAVKLVVQLEASAAIKEAKGPLIGSERVVTCVTCEQVLSNGACTNSLCPGYQEASDE